MNVSRLDWWSGATADCPLVNQSQTESLLDLRQKKLNCVAKCKWAAINIPGLHAQIKSVCQKHCHYLFS